MAFSPAERDDIQNKVIENLKSGQTFKAACRNAGSATVTVWRWASNETGFSARLELAQRSSEEVRERVSGSSAAWCSYVAGYVDADGHITLGQQGRMDRLTVMVKITSVDDRPLRRMQETWGGSIWFKDRSSLNNNQRDTWNWEISARAAERLLKEIRPYMILKAEQAFWALAYQQLTIGRAIKINWGGAKRPDPEQRAAWLDVLYQIKAKFLTMNVRGRRQFEAQRVLRYLDLG